MRKYKGIDIFSTEKYLIYEIFVLLPVQISTLFLTNRLNKYNLFDIQLSTYHLYLSVYLQFYLLIYTVLNLNNPDFFISMLPVENNLFFISFQYPGCLIFHQFHFQTPSQISLLIIYVINIFLSCSVFNSRNKLFY